MSPHIAASARLGMNNIISRSATVGEKAELGDFVTVKKHAVIGDSATIGKGSRIYESVNIGMNVKVGNEALILSGAQICPDFVYSGSSDARKLGDGVTIGECVLLHSEVELGNNAIVPTQRTIAHIGHFGKKNRVVTVYGSDFGPRFSIGCQIGVTLDHIRGNVHQSTFTETVSADTYKPFLGAFHEMGKAVQIAYEREANYVDELKARRMSLGLGVADL